MANKQFASKFKAAHTFEYRKGKADKVRERYPDRIPVICEKMENYYITDLDMNKFLIPSRLTFGQFVLVVRKRLMLEPEKALFLFIGHAIPPNATQMSDLYAKYKDEDGFLYVKCADESIFG